MATAKKTAAKKTTAKKETQGRKRIESPTSLTFVDDKRAQYARVVAVNHGIAEKIVKKGTEINAVSKSVLEKCLKSLTGGNLLDGKDGITLIQNLSKNGATHEEVAKRGLTLAYAQEVRPFIRRWQVSEAFGRRGKKAEAEDSSKESEGEAEE